MLGAAQSPGPASPLFVESAAAAGLSFTHVSGATGQYYMAEQMGAGVALFDYDNDGDLDVFLVQGGPLEPGGKIGSAHPTSRLFRNDLKVAADGRRALHFTDVTDAAGVGLRALRHGRGGRRLRQRRRPRSLRDLLRPRDALPQQRRRHLHRRHRSRRA